MPMLIRTPEQIFREEAKDIYYIRIVDDQGRDSPAWHEIQAWLRDNLPNARVEMLAPSEDSGWIAGYFGDLRVDFSDADLKSFCSHWETPGGKSLDPRFQCCLWPYHRWLEKHGHFVPTATRPNRPALTLWWDTPVGFIHHQIPEEEAAHMEMDAHPGCPKDVWMHAVKLWPELASVNPETLARGNIRPAGSESQGWCVIFDSVEPDAYSNERKRELLAWFCLPENTQMLGNW